MRIKIHPFLFNILLFLAALILSVAVGSVFIPPVMLLRILVTRLPVTELTPDWPATFETILFSIRLPHTALIALTGAALAGSGAAYQGLFRNPLADPYLIGVASGAGLGAVLSMSTSLPSTLLGMYAVPAGAFVGAGITVILVYSLSRQRMGLPTTTLILAGIAVSSFTTALTSFLMLRAENELRRALSWLLGGSLMGGWEPVLAMLPYLVIGLGILLYSSYGLNVLQFGDEQAQQLGLRVDRSKFLIIFGATLATAAAVAFAGIIGFVGLIVPHIIRMVWGSDYRRLLPLSIVAGSTGLLLADVLARLLLAPQALPVGIVTALAGAPFFLWVLQRTKAKLLW